jgi:hypothetical protein
MTEETRESSFDALAKGLTSGNVSRECAKAAAAARVAPQSVRAPASAYLLTARMGKATTPFTAGAQHPRG